jgi:hypothetical protein
MTFPDPPLIGRLLDRAPVAGREDGGAAPQSPRKRPGVTSSPTGLPAERAAPRVCASHARPHAHSARHAGFRVFTEQEYMRLVDLREAATGSVQSPHPPSAPTFKAAARTGSREVRFRASFARRSHRAFLTLAAVMGGGVAAALTASGGRVSAPRIARQLSEAGVATGRRAAPLARWRAAGDGLAATRASAAFRPLVGRRLRIPSGRTRRVVHLSPPTRHHAAAGTAHVIVARRNSGAPATATRADHRLREERRAGAPLIAADRSRETADFTFER